MKQQEPIQFNWIFIFLILSMISLLPPGAARKRKLELSVMEKKLLIHIFTRTESENVNTRS